MKKCILFVVVLFLLAPVAQEALAQPPEEFIRVYEVGEQAPDFKLNDGITGAPVEFSKDILGKGDALIALTFMNTTCSACQAEVSLLSRLAGMHEGKLKVYLIAVDMRGQKLVKSYNENYKYNVSYLLDPRFSLPPSYGFGYTPALVLLDKDGKILYKKGGYYPKDADALIKTIEDLL
jgi:thiol-disulfide isomerase/thioredoxin